RADRRPPVPNPFSLLVGADCGRHALEAPFMATTFTLSGGDIPRPYRKCRIEYFREAASQTYVKGDVLILQTTADKGDQVKISGADPSSGTVVGIAAEDASGTENT